MSSRTFALALHLFALVAALRPLPAVAVENRAVFAQSVASGDPRPDSVVLWTRVTETNSVSGDLPVRLEVSMDPSFGTLAIERDDLLARGAHDHCVKIRVAGLQPDTRYYYRFVYQSAHHSPVGRTRTAPAADAARSVRFAVLNCQDYLGRYFNTLADLAAREAESLDFVVHLGDYIYETTGDPRFQSAGGARNVRLSDTNGVIALGSGNASFVAAASLSNYRELYRVYRSDRNLQRVHELWPVVSVWDDHEFSDDAHGANGTYLDGARAELDPERKRRAEQAYFEYLPVEIGMDQQGIAVTAADLFPNTRIHRDFVFGRNLHLLLLDYRTHRPDHLISEDAFPGSVPMDEATLNALLGVAWPAARAAFDPYVDLSAPERAVLRETLRTIVTGAYVRAGVAAPEAAARADAAVAGRMSARYANGLLAAAGQAPAFDAGALAALPRGISHLLLGKQSLFSSFGSRYAVARDAYAIYAGWRAAQNASSQDVLGAAQTAWLTSALQGSAARWRIVGSSVSFCPITLDFANPPIPLPAGFPDELRGRIQLNADHWDGMPQGRQRMLDLLAAAGALVISGDIHASFVSKHTATSGAVVPEFTGTSVSSENFREAIGSIVKGNPATAAVPGIDAVVAELDLLIRDGVNRLGGTSLLDLNTRDNGYMVLEAGPERVVAVYRHLAGENIAHDLTGAAFSQVRSALVKESAFAVTRGTTTLEVASEPAADRTFRLQVLHASDLEGGVDSISDAPNFAAIAEKLAASEPNSILLSAGDNYIPGPFFSAAADVAMRGVLDRVNESYFGMTGLDIREASGRADVTVMNLIGFDASALGNHEFDAGTSTIREIVGTTFSGSGLGGVRWLGTQFPYLSANLDFSADGNLNPIFTSKVLPNTAFRSGPADVAAAAGAPKIASATLIARGGEVVGVVGATTPLLEGISSPGATRVRNPGAGSNGMASLASILQPVIDDLLARGVNKVVLVSHLQQIALEQELVPLLRGVDVVIAGGSDTLLANPGTALRPGDVAAGPYPWVARNADGDPALIVSTDGQYKYVGRLVVSFDSAGRVLTNSVSAAESQPYRTDTAGVEAVWGNLEAAFMPGTKGALVREVTEGVKGIVTAKDAVVLGRSDVFLEGRRNAVRTEESNLGNLTADANLWLARQVDPSVSVSVKNGGGIRAEIGSVDGFTGALKPTAANPLSGKREGEVSQLDVENSLRFNNQLTLVTVTAAGLRDLLEHGVSATRPGSTPGQFPQVGGVRVLYDISRAGIRLDGTGRVTTPGERIRHLQITGLDGDVSDTVVRDGVLVGDPERKIRIVTLNFLADAQAANPGLGGDGYPFPSRVSDRVDLVPALASTPGMSTFAIAGSEQDALAEYLLARFTAKAFTERETIASRDLRLGEVSVAAPRFLGVARTASGTELLVPTVPGRTYRVEAAPGASGPWEVLAGGQFTGDGNAKAVQDSDAGVGSRIYRVAE